MLQFLEIPTGGFGLLAVVLIPLVFNNSKLKTNGIEMNPPLGFVVGILIPSEFSRRNVAVLGNPNRLIWIAR